MGLRVILPGDALPSSSSGSASASSSSLAAVKLGPGLQSIPVSFSSSTPSSSTTTPSNKGKAREEMFANRAGLLGYQQDGDTDKWWVEGETRRYNPQPPEPVIGVITGRHAEGYRVDIGGSQSASLDALAFEGATKRSKPNLKIGAIVYGHLLATPSFSEPEISCVDAATQKAAGFGELVGGFMVRGVELGRCRSLLSPKNPILPAWGAKFPFEVAVGMNGRVWVKAAEGEEERIIELVKEIRGRD